jgi:hypothetical protein
VEIVRRPFAMKYEQLEKTFRRLARNDSAVYLPNPRPRTPVDFIFIAMEPSLGAKSAEERKARVSQGQRNFLSTIEDFCLHFAIRKFLCRPGEAYHVTDISKGSMFVRQARRDRGRRWDHWYPSLVREIKLVAKPDAKIIAIGKKVEEFLETKKFRRLDATILHYSATAARHRKKAVVGRKKEFKRFAAAVTLEHIAKVAEEATSKAEISGRLRRQILGKLRRHRALSPSLKQLVFAYKIDFEAMKCQRTMVAPR